MQIWIAHDLIRAQQEKKPHGVGVRSEILKILEKPVKRSKSQIVVVAEATAQSLRVVVVVVDVKIDQSSSKVCS